MEQKDVAVRGAGANVIVVEGGGKVDLTMKTLYAFAILFIVSGHVLTGPGYAGPSLAYNMFPPPAFHVACFVFVAGYFYKSKNEQAPLGFLKKRVKRLLIPLYGINAAYAVWTVIAHGIGFTFGQDPNWYNLLLDPLFGGHAYMWNLCMWFVAPLFCTQMVDFGLRLLLRVGESRVKEAVLFAVYLACGITTAALCGSDGFAECSSHPLVLLARTGFFLPCYGMGRIYRVFLAEHDKAPNWLYFGVVMALQLLVIVICAGKVGYIVSWCWFLTGPVIPFVTTALGIAFWLRISRIVSPGLAGSKVMRCVADNTFSIMAHQFLGIFLVKGIFALVFLAGGVQTFDMGAFLNDFWYYYTPELTNGASMAFGAVYVAGGMILPLAMHDLWLRIKKRASKLAADR